MTGFNFARKEDAQAAIQLARRANKHSLHPKSGVSPIDRWTQGFLLETPEAGIDALDTSVSPNVASSAECTPYYIAEDGSLTEITADDGTAIVYDVWNVSSSKVAGYSMIQAKLVFDKLVVDMEDCG